MVFDFILFLKNFFPSKVVSQVTDIVSKVNYLGPNDIVSDGSTVGNILSQLQPQINATLADKVLKTNFSKKKT